MKTKPSLYLIFFTFLLLFLRFISQAQVSEEDLQNRCRNNKDEISRLTKLITALNTSLGQAWTKDKIEHARTDLVLTKQALKALQSYKPLKAMDKATDKEILKEKIDPLFIADIHYTSEKYTLAYFFNRDFDENGKLLKTSPFNTIRRLFIVRDSIAKKIDRAVALESKRAGWEKQVRESTDQVLYHQNRFIELKCDDLPAETVKNKSEKINTPIKEQTTNSNKEQSGNSTNYPITSNKAMPSLINLSEDKKSGKFTITLTRTKGDQFEGVYNNGQKAVFQLVSYRDVFTLRRLYITYADYTGSLTGNSSSGTIIGSGGGKFTASFQ